MRRKSYPLLGRYLRERRRLLSERPRVIKGFLDELSRALCSSSTVIVFGGRGSPDVLYTSEPRDLDLLIVTSLDKDYVEKLVSSLKPKGLPVDLIVVSLEEYRSSMALVEKMLSRSIVVCDGLGIYRGDKKRK